MSSSNKSTLKNAVSRAEIATGLLDIPITSGIDGLPSKWCKVNNMVGSIKNNVCVEISEDIMLEGEKSIKVNTISPCGGIQQSIGNNAPNSWMVYPNRGRGALHFAKSDGTSAFFSKASLLQTNFPIQPNGESSTAIRCVHALRLDNGDLVEIFSASCNSESNNEGAVYMKRNGGSPSLFKLEHGYKIWPWPGVVELKTTYLWISMRLDANGENALYATNVSRNFNFTSNDRLLYAKKGFNLQAYNMIRLSNGRYIIPVTYALTSQINNGPWMLDILYTDDNFETVKPLDAPKTLTGRGLMEPHPVMLSSGKVAILCRTNQGYLARSIFDPDNNTLSNAILTEIAQSESGSYAKNLHNGDIIMSWVSSINSRKFVVMAISSDDMESWKSFHIITSSEALGDSMENANPYVHQPFIFQDGTSIVAYIERVVSPTITSLYKSISVNYNIDNVSNKLNSWQKIECKHFPDNIASLQLINVINKDGEVYYNNAPI